MLLSLRLKDIRELNLAEANTPPLKFGDNNPGVAAVQNLLFDLGFSFAKTFTKGHADGIFGNETKANVEAFQRKNGLKVDGLVGRMTMGKLDGMIIENNILERHTDAQREAVANRNRNLPLPRRTDSRS